MNNDKKILFFMILFFSSPFSNIMVHANDWPMFQNDVFNSGFTKSKTPQNNELIWSLSLGEKISPPILYNGRIYLGSTTQEANIEAIFYSINTKTGEIDWDYTCKSPTNPHSGGIAQTAAAIYKNKVYFGVDYWMIGPQGNLVVYHTLNCLNAKTGEYQWNYTIIGDEETHHFSSPTIYKNKLYIGTSPVYEPSLICLDAASGEFSWGTDHLEWGFIRTTPAASKNRIYIGDLGSPLGDGKVGCLNAKTGEVIWTYKRTNYETFNIWGSPTIYDNKLYVISMQGLLLCLNSENGAQIWSHSFNERSYSTPAVHKNKVYILAGDHVHCFDAMNGSKMWSSPCQTANIKSGEGNIVIADEKVHIGSLVLDAETGELVHVYPTNGGSTIIAGGKVYITSKDTIYCFGDKKQSENRFSIHEAYLKLRIIFNSLMMQRSR
jgi:outer membrane protein assembly factor BamB